MNAPAALAPRERLVAALASGDVLLVAGAGVGRALAGDSSPTWRALVESGVEDILAKELQVSPSWQGITEQLIATGATEELVEAASRVERAMGTAEFGPRAWDVRGANTIKGAAEHERGSVISIGSAAPAPAERHLR